MGVGRMVGRPWRGGRGSGMISPGNHSHRGGGGVGRVPSNVGRSSRRPHHAGGVVLLLLVLRGVMTTRRRMHHVLWRVGHVLPGRAVMRRRPVVVTVMDLGGRPEGRCSSTATLRRRRGIWVRLGRMRPLRMRGPAAISATSTISA